MKSGLLAALFVSFAIRPVEAQLRAPQLSPLTEPEAIPTQRSPLPGVQQPTAPQILPPGAAPALPEDANDPTPVALTAVVFEGASVYSNATLTEEIGGLHPGRATLGEVLTGIRRLQYRYRSDGYILTKVSGKLVPGRQGYTLQVQVIEGFIASVKLSGNIGPAGNKVYDYLEVLTAQHPLTEKALERAILLCEDIPGVSVRTILRPSKDQPGAVALVAQVTRKQVDLYGSLDNRGSRATGPEEFVLDAAVNSLTSLGDRTEIVLFNTPFDREELFGQISESVLVGSSGLKLRGYLGYGELEPGDTLKPLEYRSRLLLSGISAEYPIIRTRALSSSAAVSLDLVHAVVDANVSSPDPTRLSKEDLRVLRIDSHTQVQDSLLGATRLGANDIDVQLSRGIPGLFGGTPNRYLPAARLGERRDFSKATFNFSRSQYLGAWATDSLGLYLAVGGQVADSVLPPSEKFFLGGTQFGRGFYSGELSGDDAIAGTIEVQWNMPRTLPSYAYALPLDLQFYGFYDGGQVWDRPTADVRSDLGRHLESLGMGVRSTIARHYFVQLEGADRLTPRPDPSETGREKNLALFFRVGVKL
jgi:hemolysin activation/secretion protein